MTGKKARTYSQSEAARSKRSVRAYAQVYKRIDKAVRAAGLASKTVFDLEELLDYLVCPYRYLLYHVVRLRRPLPVDMAELPIHQNVIATAIADRTLSLKAMVDIFAAAWENALPYMRPTGAWAAKHSRDVRIYFARNMYAPFRDITLKLIPDGEYTRNVEKEFDCHGITIKARIPYESDMWRLCFENYHAGYRDQAKMMVSDRMASLMSCPPLLNYGLVLLPRTRTSASVIDFREYSATQNQSSARGQHALPRMMRFILRDAAEAIRSGSFPRVSLATPFCAVDACEFFEECTSVRETTWRKALFGAYRNYGGIATWISLKDCSKARTAKPSRTHSTRHRIVCNTSRIELPFSNSP